MSEKPKIQIILVHERVLQSWLRDLGTFAMFVALIGLGVLVESTAMQWTGAIIGFIAILARASSHRVLRLSIPEARARLDEIERVEAA
jgi:hypothetical protein